jgi:predicted enzyme related to lactoylglutathione lyase
MPAGPTHFELGVDDAERAKVFYSKLFGWTFHPTGEGREGWIETGGVPGGLHENDPNPGVVVYFSVPDLDHALTTAGELGGQPGRPSAEEPGFGRFAECIDDQGTRFGLHQPPSAGTPGSAGPAR